MKKNIILAIFMSACLSVVSTAAKATVTFIDLNDFFADPTVSVAVDGLSATMAEDPSFPTVLLANDPGLGDPDVIIPSVGAMLKFDYIFSEGAGNDDEFFAAVLGDDGFSILGFEFLVDSSSSGMVSFDLSSLVGAGAFLGFQFQLDSFDQFLDSTVEIRNLRIETPDIVDVPLPPVTGLMLLGLIGLNISRKKRMVNKNII